ncbi:MAG TPA: L-serine ammonia-lyase, iron-sulfur-dependent, subunit alpha [Clostridiales bacterium]|nr:L-serine ammonia-lyase, iron-sulfur-dependent, subunit alpha [Clostridiales bacterium]
MLTYKSINEIVEAAEKEQKNISQIVIYEQSLQLNSSIDELYLKMSENLKVMKAAVEEGLASSQKSISGLSGGDAVKLKKHVDSGYNIGGKFFCNMLQKAIAIAETNAHMGRIVAAPTAGSCGIIPAVLLTIGEENDISEDKIIMSLFTSAAIGMVIANRASISGAEGGCQAECGSASAMAAGAAVEALGGTPKMISSACSIALKNVLGLVCDPVAGLVEVPCIKRNAMGAANALAAAEMALAGIESVIPADEVIDAMRSIGNLMPVILKETAEGGLAASPTARKLAGKILC